MNLKQYSDLTKIADEVASINNTKLLSNSFGSIKRTWSDAIMYNKRQNELIKNGYLSDNIKHIHCLDEDTNKLVYIGLKPTNYKLTRKKWFALLIAEEQSLTRQQIKELIKN